jgi:glycosyltransferase involved in cell wall biosynthesis
MSATTFRPLLSVCIPTLDRLAFLRQNLESLMPQARELGVEICVCDNASGDGTQEYLQHLQDSNPSVRVMRQDVRVGIDRNMMTAIGMASGRYVYPLGDDDLVPAGRLSAIVALLREPAGMILLNGWHTDAALAPKSEHLPKHLAGTTYTDPAEAFGVLWDRMPFGAFLAARHWFDPALAERFMGTSHAYAGVIWAALAVEQGQSGAIAIRCGVDPVVCIRGAEKTWRASSVQIHFQGIPNFFDLVALNPIYARIAQTCKHHFLESKTTYRELLNMRLRGELRPANVAMLGKDCDAAQKRRMKISSTVPRWLLAMSAPILRATRRSAALANILIKKDKVSSEHSRSDRTMRS